MTRQLVLLFLVLAHLGCGGTLKLEPLVGEDPQVQAMIQKNHPKRRDISTLRAAILRVYKAIQHKDYATLWSLLSTPTRSFLSAAGKEHGLTGLLLLKSSRIPKAQAMGQLVTVDLVHWLLMPNVREVVSHLSGVAPRAPEKHEAMVYLVDKENQFKLVRLHREADGWKLHPGFE